MASVTDKDKGRQIVSEEGETEEPIEELEFDIREGAKKEKDSHFNLTEEERQKFGLVEADKEEIELEVDPPAPDFGIMENPAEELFGANHVLTA
eukprot:11861694-Ditylum_brightwellii.AAC.1